MREVKVGQVWKWYEDHADTDAFRVTNIVEGEDHRYTKVFVKFCVDGREDSYPLSYWDRNSVLVEESEEALEPENNQLSPNVYQFPNGVEVKDISAHLTSFGGQAVQYIARATRLDGVVKGLPVQDLYKAIELLKWEAERMEALQK